MAKQVNKATNAKATNAKATNAKATKATNDKASEPVAFVARKRAGVLAIEAAGGNVATVTIVKPPRMVVGGGDTSRAEACLAMLRQSPTIGAYVAAREKAGLGATLGGYLPGWLEKGFVAVAAPTGDKASKGKVAKGKAAKAHSEPAKV